MAPSDANAPVYRRVLIKISGEALQGQQAFGIEPAMLTSVASQLAEVHAAGVQFGLVVGGGNFFRGVAGAARGMDRVRADHMGMLATCINALALAEALTQQGVPARVLSAVPVGAFAETFSRDLAIRTLDEGGVVVFAAGTGNPYFSTDTAASLRAVEIGAQVLLKATKVDGVYDKDPAEHDDAVRFDHLTYDQVVERQLRVMDLTAVTLCRENDLPIRVFDLFTEGAIMGVLRGESLGTTVGG